MASSSRAQHRPYQGYPYVDPVVIDVPSIDSATAAKWANLPRKLIGAPMNKKLDTVGHSEETNELHGQTSVESKEDIPVVYIDLPEETQREITVPRRPEREEENGGYIEETIFYDPFEDRRIDVNKSEEQKAENATSSSNATPPPQSSRPAPPHSLNLCSPGSSGYGSSSSPSPMPNTLAKETQVYGQSSPDDGFSLTPLPVTDFQEPPPAYTEIDSPGVTVVNPPRTEVIVPDQSAAVGLPSNDRKLITCQFCGVRVHTLVMRESGIFTHFIAVLTVIMCIIPLTVIIYCTNCCKYRNHYCPNCNQMVGYEVPLLCQSMVYTSK